MTPCHHPSRTLDKEKTTGSMFPSLKRNNGFNERLYPPPLPPPWLLFTPPSPPPFFSFFLLLLLSKSCVNYFNEEQIRVPAWSLVDDQGNDNQLVKQVFFFLSSFFVFDQKPKFGSVFLLSLFLFLFFPVLVLLVPPSPFFLSFVLFPSR